MLKLATGITALFTITGIVCADLYMKQKQHTDSYTVANKTEPAKDEVISIWIGDKGLRSAGPQQSVLIRLDKSTVYVIDNDKKSYSEIPFTLFESAGSAPQMEGLPDFVVNMMKMTASVTPTDETKTIGKYNCKKYIQKLENSMMKSETNLWVTKDIPVNVTLYKKYLTAILASSAGMKQMLGDLSKELNKIDGVYVYSSTVSTVMNNQLKSTTEIIEIKEDTAPAETYEIPAKYKKTDWNK